MIKEEIKMSRCKSCDHIMKRCDLEIPTEDHEKEEPKVFEEDICKSCRQEIYKYSDDGAEIGVRLGFSLEELMMMEEGLYLDYRSGGFQE